ncbi:MAG: Ig-like domain-containing protein [Bacteroides sp.]|nr:Ig-like domain-containing protein [Bacteroides sp.]MCM1414230.1 Ig-like domain-containing protein [Bacteroides sp.]MCM1472389.1 Ig-like domain-containing protein [Bacteroides sp.]
MKRESKYVRMLLAAVVALVVAACASMGRPQGGPVDETPPRYMRSNPMPGALNVDNNRIIIYFDENVQVKDVMNKVVVSPVQSAMPKVTGVGNQVRVQLADTLLPDMTYTIDFTDAISDLNESNEIDGFAFAFSTGSTIDSMSISGMVLDARTLEPAQGILVGVHSNLSDTALRTLPFDRVTRTNQLGQFTVRNLQAVPYNVFALDDVNRDYKWDRTENVAFYGQSITPTSMRVEVTDTLEAADGSDSLATRMATAFAPNDVLLAVFNEDYKSQYMSKYERRDRNRFYFEFGAPSDTLPVIRFVGGAHDGELIDGYTVLEGSLTHDTLTYWMTDTSMVATDSLKLAVSYLRTDSLEQLSWTTDTLQFNVRGAKKAKKKEEKKQEEETTDSTQTTPKIDLLKLATPNGTIDVFSRMTIGAQTPILSVDTTMLHLEIQVDTLWEPVEMPSLAPPDRLKPLTVTGEYQWEPGSKYRLTIDSLAIKDIYGLWNGPITSEFNVRALNEYGNVTFLLPGAPENVIVELLDNGDKPVRTVTASNGRAVFSNVMPNTYYARLYIDSNGNGKYDTGNVTDSIQPEETSYYNKKVVLKKNWDIEQTWDIYEIAVDQQKPLDIKKNKPKDKNADRNRNDEEEDDQYYDEFGNPAVDPDDPFGKRKNNKYNTLEGRDRNTHTQGAGYR